MRLPPKLAKLLAATSRKQAQMQAKLMSGLVKSGLILLVCIASAWFLAGVENNFFTERQAMQGKVNGLTGEVSALEGKLVKAQEAFPAYDVLTKQFGGPQVPLDRQRAKEIMETLRDTYLLSALRLNISGLRETSDPSYKNAHVTAIACDITLAIDATTDEFIFFYLQNLREALPGAFRTSSVTLSRLKDITPESLPELMQKGKQPNVHAEIRLLWAGMKANAAPAPGKTP